MKKIYIKEKKEKNETVLSYLTKFLAPRVVNTFITLNPLPTYEEKECNIIQCERYRARSIDDIYSVCLSKFPNLTFSTFSRILLGFAKDNNLHFLRCPDINSWVLRRSTTYQTVDEITRVKDFYLNKRIGKLDKEGAAEYSVYDLLIAAGIEPDYLE